MSNQNNKNNLTAIGLMSGTSLDGLDIVVAKFTNSDNLWSYDLIDFDCIEYASSSAKKLKNAHLLNASDFIMLHADYGDWIGKNVIDFLHRKQITRKIDVIGSHGHTVLHQPQDGFTFQIGNGANIATTTKISTICDLRSNDISLGGQGAPIVPIGEQYLFPKYKGFINIGGIANIAIHQDDHVLAYDVCPANTVLNQLSKKLGFEFDRNGLFASKGQIDSNLLKELNKFYFYDKSPPRSLHTDVIIQDFMPFFEASTCVIADKLATAVEHIAIQIANEINKYLILDEVLVTGGGALNTYLIDRIQSHSNAKIVVPETALVNYKEALIMAFLAVLRLNEQENCLASVTGAQRNSVGGALYIG